MTAALHPAEPALATDRARRGGRAGKRAGGSAAFEQPPFRQLKNPVRADQAGLRRRAGIDPPRLAARAEGDRRRRAARRRAPDHEGARRRRARRQRARALRRRHDPRTDRALPGRIHASMRATRRTMCASAATIWSSRRWRRRPTAPTSTAAAAPATRRTIRNFLQARADAQHPEHDRRLSGRAGRHPSVGPPPRMHPRPRRR